jgi:prepilin-type N-terminal cleavage/methylation domain-containing protein
MLNMFTPKAPKCACSDFLGEEAPYYSLNTGVWGHSTNDEKNLKSRSKIKKFFGFTLAEVLITLGIIGVVSAMTIPALINKCQKVVLANQAKKEYAMWTQVFKDILADNNTTSLSETELWGKSEGYVSNASNPTTTNTAFWTELGKYVKIISVGERGTGTKVVDSSEYRTESGHYLISLLDGSMLEAYWFRKTPNRKTDLVCSTIKVLGGSMCSEIGMIAIDVNGLKGPNTIGRDVFEFHISDEGVLYPYGGKDYALYLDLTPIDSNIPTTTMMSEYYDEYGNVHTVSYTPTTGRQNAYYWKNSVSKCSSGTLWICAQRTGQLMEEGWKMNY